jgi:hypothetical protein
MGIDGLSVEPDASIAGISTDYERTYLRPARYLDVLALTRGAALILGDRPMITGVWKNSLNQVVIPSAYGANPNPLRTSALVASKSALNSGFCSIRATITVAPIWPASQSDG